MSRLRLWLARLFCPRTHHVVERPVGWIKSVGNNTYQFMPMTEEEFHAL